MNHPSYPSKEIHSGVPFVQYCSRIINKEYKPVSVSENISMLTGYTQAEWYAATNPLINIMHPADRDLVYAAYNNALQTGAELQIQYRLIDENGLTKWIQDIATVTKTGKEGCIELKGHMFDVSGKKRDGDIVKTLLAYQFALNETAIISLTDSDGRIIYVNNNFLQYSGYTRSELIGKTHRIINSGFHPQAYFSEMWKTLRTGQPWRGEIRNKSKDGTFFWVDTVITPVLNEQKKVVQFLSIRNIITKQKEQEESIRQSEEKFRDIVESTSDMILSVDRHGLIVFVNKSWLNRLGYTVENVAGRSVFNFISPESKTYFKHIYCSLKNESELQSVAVTFLSKCGEKVYGEGNINARFENGEMVLTRGIFRDVSDTKKMMEVLERKQNQLNEAQRLARLGSWHLDTRLQLLEWSDEARRIFEIKPGTAVSYELFLSSIHPEDRALVKDAQEAASAGKPYNLEHRLLINGKLKWVRSIVRILFDENNTPFMYIGSVQDITDKKLAEIEQQNIQLQLNEAQRTAKIGNYEWDTKKNLVSGSDQFFQLLGIRRKKNYEFDLLFKNVHPDDQLYLQKSIQESIVSSERFSIQFRYITPDGLIKHFEAIRQTKVVTLNDTPLFSGTLQDITDLKKAEQKLFSLVIEAEENERKRIAAELHDGACQYLATSKLLLQTIDTSSEKPIKSQKLLLDKVIDSISESMRLTRNVSQQLVPLILYEEGLHTAVHELVLTQNIADSERYYFITEGKPVNPESNISINLYRIIQEFINNSQKYSAASQIKVKLVYAPDTLEIHLSDNGRGFDLARVKKQKGIGLFNMTNRIQTLGGRYRYNTKPGKGVSLKLFIPLTEFRFEEE